MIPNSFCMSRWLSSLVLRPTTNITPSGVEEETSRSRWRINHGICHRKRALCVTLASLLVYSLMLTLCLCLGCSQEGVAGEGSPSVRRLVRNAITDHPTLLGSFINTRGSPSRSGAIISQSQRNPPSPLPPPPLPSSLYSSKQYDKPSYLCPPSLSPSPADCQYGCAGI